MTKETLLKYKKIYEADETKDEVQLAKVIKSLALYETPKAEKAKK